jgi:hypothetical protein
MKILQLRYIILYIFLFTKLVVVGSSGDQIITFKASFPEGFGAYMNREVILKLVDLSLGGKAEGKKKIYILTNEVDTNGHTGNDKLVLAICSEEDEVRLVKEFGDKDTIKVKVLGYEIIESYGHPAVSESAKDEDILIPGGFGWRARQVFIIEKFEITQNK